MSSRQVISGPEVPQSIGPYSQAVRVGDLLFASTTVLAADAGAFAELNELYAEFRRTRQRE